MIKAWVNVDSLALMSDNCIYIYLYIFNLITILLLYYVIVCCLYHIISYPFISYYVVTGYGHSITLISVYNEQTACTTVKDKS